MPWCPNCRIEYRDGVEQCSDCKIPLVEALTQQQREKQPQYVEQIPLITADNEVEADAIASLLRAQGFSPHIAHQGGGSYIKALMGGNNLTTFALTVTVPRHQYAQARELLKGWRKDSWERAEDGWETLVESQKQRGKRKYLWLWLGIPTLSILLFLLLLLWDKLAPR